MNTVFLLMAQFGPRAVIPFEDVRREYFSHLVGENFGRKISSGEIPLPVVRTDKSKKTTKGFYVQDLADFIDKAREDAIKERNQLCGIKLA